MKTIALILVLFFSIANLYSQKTPEDFFQRGLVDQDFKVVISDFTNAIRLKPDFKKAYYFRASAYMHNNEYNKALLDITKAIRLDSLDADYFNLRGLVYLKLNNQGEALESFNKAIIINPSFAEAYYNRGVMLNMLENNIKPTRGCSDIKKAKKLGYKVLDIELTNCK
jgi:tetratricopeptide (TPR) repeat protein